MKNLLAGLLILCSLTARTQVTTFSFTNKPISDVELPNYGRGAHYWNGTQWDNSGAPQVPPGTPTSGAKTHYVRYQWCYMEGAQGVFTFTKASLGNNWWKSLESSLEWCANNGALMGFGGVMTAYDGGDGASYDGGVSQYPYYLHQMMQAETTKDWKYNNRDWIPNWNSPSYLERWRVLNDTALRYILSWQFTPSSGPWAGKLVKGKNLIDFIDLRGYGNFGEWHTWPWTQNQPANAICTDSSMKKIIDIAIDIWGDYPLHIPIAIFDDNGWSESNAFRCWYVLTRKTRHGVVGWRRDNIGDAGYDNFLIGNTWTYGNWKADTAILNRWKYAMITGEPLNGSAPCCPYFYHVRSEIANYHYAGFGNGNYGSRTQQTWDTINAVFKLTGYRYNLTGGYLSTILQPKQDFKIGLTWRNVGASPLYQKRWRVVYQLKNSNNVEVGRWISKLNPYLFLPDSKDTLIPEQFTLGDVLVNGIYKMTVKIEDTTGLCAPLYLALNSPTRNTDGSYTLQDNILLTAPLPIKWHYFNARNKLNRIELAWIVSADEQNDRFEVEKSLDGQHFQTIGVVKRQASWGATEVYKFEDFNISPGNLFYRIRQINLDGTAIYSRVVLERGEVIREVRVSPNPAQDRINVELNSVESGRVRISVYNSEGRLVWEERFTKFTTTTNTILSLKAFPRGTYTLKVTVEGSLQGVHKIIKIN